jgi:hypothetical protein
LLILWIILVSLVQGLCPAQINMQHAALDGIRNSLVLAALDPLLLSVSLLEL